MAVAAKDVTETGADLIVAITAQTAPVIIQEPEKFAEFQTKVFDAIKEFQATPRDMSKKADREAVRSFVAQRLVKSRTFLEKTKLAMTEDWRKRVEATNANWREIESWFKDVEADARKPLTDWEEAEAAREERHKAALTYFQRAATILAEDTSETLAARLAEVRAYEITEALFGDKAEAVTGLQAQTIAALEPAIERARKAEEEAAELEKLRREKEERERAEAEAREKAERQAANASDEFAALASVAPTDETTLDEVERHLDWLAERDYTADDFGAEAAAKLERARADAIRDLTEAKGRLEKEAADRAAEEARKAQADRADALIAHIEECGRGTIGGQPQPFGILIYELDTKIVIDDGLGEHQARVRKVRDETLSHLKSEMERQAEEREQREREEAAAAERKRIEDEAAIRRAEEDQRRADAEHRRARINDVAKSLREHVDGLTPEHAFRCAEAMADGKVAHVTVEF